MERKWARRKGEHIALGKGKGRERTIKALERQEKKAKELTGWEGEASWHSE